MARTWRYIRIPDVEKSTSGSGLEKKATIHPDSNPGSHRLPPDPDRPRIRIAPGSGSPLDPTPRIHTHPRIPPPDTVEHPVGKKIQMGGRASVTPKYTPSS
eukprot:1194744-Prorocentrum_minimum.AAC.4